MSKTFNSRLLEALPRIDDNRYPSVFDPIINVLRRYNENDFQIFYENQQPIHGDLNNGNILIKKGKVYFFDFEDTAKSYFSPLIDLAFLIERSLLTNSAVLNHNIDEVLCSYSDRSPVTLNYQLIPRILELISVRSLLVLILNYDLYRIVPNPKEVAKFLRNRQVAENMELHLKK